MATLEARGSWEEKPSEGPSAQEPTENGRSETARVKAQQSGTRSCGCGQQGWLPLRPLRLRQQDWRSPRKGIGR